MQNMPIWEVSLYLDGPVTVRGRVLTTQQKGFHIDDPFYSNIEIEKIPSGLKATVTARAQNHMIAYKAALFFFGSMVDALTLNINRPLYLSFTERHRRPIQRHDVRRVIEKEQFERAFNDAHLWECENPAFLRSLGWYRKGLTTDDPLDKFLAFWNAIEIIAAKYYNAIPSVDMKQAKLGIKNQVRACFDALWGSPDGWPVIPGQVKWIDNSYEVRKGVAHGVASIDVHKVTEVAAHLSVIEEVSYNFLCDWRHTFLDCDRP